MLSHAARATQSNPEGSARTKLLVRRPGHSPGESVQVSAVHPARRGLSGRLAEHPVASMRALQFLPPSRISRIQNLCRWPMPLLFRPGIR